MDPVMTIMIMLIAGAVAVAVYAVATQLDERHTVRESLRQLDGYEVENQRETEMLEPLRERALRPILEGLSGLGQRLTPTGYVDKVRTKFVHMGSNDPQSVDRFLAVRVATVVGAFVVFFFTFVINLTPLQGTMRLVAGGAVILVLLIGPDSWLNKKVDERRLAIERALPDVLDLLTISVEAGLGFEQALDRVIKAVPGPLTDELARMLGEVRAGAARAESLRAMEVRCGSPDVRSVVLAIIQADQFGVSIGRVLRGLAEEMRIKRRQLAQERAQKAPIKMLLPMVFCIFPAIFVVVLAPAMISIMESL